MKAIISLSVTENSSWTPSQSQCEEWISAALLTANYEGSASISLKFVNEDESTLLNEKYRSKNKPTNVLSFPSNLPPEIQEIMDVNELGDLAICTSVVEQESREQNKPLAAHWAHLVIHGVLHLLGFDHETDLEAEIMEAMEIRVMSELGLSDPYQNIV